MNRNVVIAMAMLVGGFSSAQGQALAPVADPPLQGPADEKSRGAIPTWLKLGAELRGRVESGTDFDGAPADRLYMNRLRLNIGVQPASWIRFFVQGQDARAFGLAGGDNGDLEPDTFDMHQAYVELGQGEKGWQLRFGRQELAIGEERMIGADGYWDPFGQSFDAIRVSYGGARLHFDSFAGFRVVPSPRSIDPYDTASRVSGALIQIKTRGDGVLEPYFLWKRGEDTHDLCGHPGHRDVLSPGLRAQGALPFSLEYDAEMAIQRGHVVTDHISAWAGHWELGWRPLGKESGPRLGVEYNYASGDQDPSDRKHGTFDDFFPAGFNKYGMADPIAWRNIRYPGASVEVPLTKRWTVYGGYRWFALANIHDGLYPGGDDSVLRNAAAISAVVGNHVLVSAAYTRGERWRVYGGYGYLFPGTYLHESGFTTRLRTVYLQSSLSF